MSCENHTPNVENLVRSGVVLAVGLPLALSLGGLTGALTRTLEQQVCAMATHTYTHAQVRQSRHDYNMHVCACGLQMSRVENALCMSYDTATGL